jgi:hypothetical protein
MLILNIIKLGENLVFWCFGGNKIATKTPSHQITPN